MTVKTVNDRNALNTHVRAVKQAKNTVRFIFALLITLVFIFPIFWMVSTSLKPEDEVLNATQTLLPVKWQFSNYATVMRKEPFLRYMLNTAIVTAGSMLLELSTGILAAYSFARGRYRGKHAMFIFVLGAMMVPIQVTFVPLYVMIARAGLKNTYLGLIIVGAVSPYTIFMLRQAFMGVDESYLDAARVDGMGKLGVIFRIMVPMCKPTVITVALTVVNVIPVIREKQGKSGAALGKRGMAVCMAVVVAITGVSIAMLRKGGGASLQDAIAKYGSDTLKLYIPGEYMSEELIPNFEKEYGVKVIVELFDSNEMMYTKLQAGDSYDVVVPSDYMIQRMLADDALQELDKDLIPNLDNLTPEVKNLPYDPDNTYSVPYFWGSVGIIYNHNNVDPAEVEEQGFDILRNPKYKGHIYMYDSERDAFMVALKALGYSMNTSDADEIQAAYEWLLDMNNTMNPTYVTDEVIDGMANGNKDIAIVYSGDATYVQSENEDMSYWMPKEGTNLWYDAMVVPKNAQNPLLAQEFINYTLTYEAALGNSEYVGYTSPNEEVMLELSGEEGMYGAYEAYIPRSGYEKDEVFQDNPILKKKIAELWIKVKASKG